MMQKITPFLWFDDNAEEAVNFYLSVFNNSKITDMARYSDIGPGQPGQVMTIAFELNGQKFAAINGGPHFKFTPAISFAVTCDTQAELDNYWDKLLIGGEPQQCGWLTDKYGLSWQIVPSQLSDWMQDPNPVKAQAVMQAMLKMIKLDIGELERAYAKAL